MHWNYLLCLRSMDVKRCFCAYVQAYFFGENGAEQSCNDGLLCAVLLTMEMGCTQIIIKRCFFFCLIIMLQINITSVYYGENRCI